MKKEMASAISFLHFLFLPEAGDADADAIDLHAVVGGDE